MYILGISAFYHDASATLLKDGEIIAATQEERFTRRKHDAEFPTESIKYCLEFAGISLNELDAIVFYDKPLLKFERILETYYAFAPKGVKSFLKAMPIWLTKKLFLKKVIREELYRIQVFEKKSLKILFSEHHLSHAASAFYPSNFESAAILVIDGVGEWATTSICYGTGSRIQVLKQCNFPNSIGLLYSSFTYFIGFKVNSGEYKLMGLAAYGNPESDQTKQFVDLIRNKLVKIFEDGSVLLNYKYFDFAVGLKMVNEKKFEVLFGLPRRGESDEISQAHCNLAFAIQYVTEEIVLKLANHAKKLTDSQNICLAGGVALNCVANGKLKRSELYNNIYIQPASGDAGGSLGAALAVHHIFFENERITNIKDPMKGSYLGPSYSGESILEMIEANHAVAKIYENRSDLYKYTAEMLSIGKIFGWFQGRMEFGPRALGNRSILADPRNSEMQKTLNLRIKFREGFRPFAPSVLEEDAGEYFELYSTSPFMLLTTPVLKRLRKQLPPNYHDYSLRNKLYFQRSIIPAVTHIDFSSRVQTVNKENNRVFYELLQTFKEHTGCSVLINTSFNVRSEPIVCTPREAYQCFMRTEMDFLVIENFLFKKSEQPAWCENRDWINNIDLD